MRWPCYTEGSGRSSRSATKKRPTIRHEWRDSVLSYLAVFERMCALRVFQTGCGPSAGLRPPIGQATLTKCSPHSPHSPPPLTPFTPPHSPHSPHSTHHRIHLRQTSTITRVNGPNHPGFITKSPRAADQDVLATVLWSDPAPEPGYLKSRRGCGRTGCWPHLSRPAHQM